MNPPRTLLLFAAGLAGVLGVSLAAGSIAEPVGLSNAEPAAAEHGGMPEGMVPGLGSADEDVRLIPDHDVAPAGRARDYRFRIEGEDGVVTAFDVEHTKRMHVIVVRRDFEGFQHLHPTMDPDGRWSVPLTVEAAGAYRVFADFVIDGDKHVLATDLFVGGAFDPAALPPAAADSSAGDGYAVHLEGAPVAGEESELRFEVTRRGRPVRDVGRYLGARGHLVALRDGDLAYLHVHPDEDRLHFEATFPTPGPYRLFLQFRHDGELRTAAFTIDVTEESR